MKNRYAFFIGLCTSFIIWHLFVVYHLLGVCIFLYVCMMRRSILLGAVRISLSCSLVVLQVLVPYIIEGVTTDSKSFNQCPS